MFDWKLDAHCTSTEHNLILNFQVVYFHNIADKILKYKITICNTHFSFQNLFWCETLANIESWFLVENKHSNNKKIQKEKSGMQVFSFFQKKAYAKRKIVGKIQTQGKRTFVKHLKVKLTNM